jgi:hypothetical protein
MRKFNFLIPRSRFAIALPTSPTRDRTPNIPKAIASPHITKTANCLQQRFAIAPPHHQNSELLAAALRYRIPHPKQRTASSSASLSHSTHPKSELLAAALRYRTSTHQNSELLAAALRYRTSTHQNSELLAAALRYRTQHPQKAIPRSRFAIALPHPQKRFLGRASLSHPHKLKTAYS